MLRLRGLAFLLPTLVVAQVTSAATIFSDNYDSLAGSPVVVTANGSSVAAGYTVNNSAANNRVEFGYNYGDPQLGIPSAPHSTGGTQIGVRLDANNSGAASALAIMPNIAAITGDYSLRFDAWMNTVGPMPAGGTGSTEHMTAGVGYNGTTFQNGASASGVWFAWDNEGGFTGTSATPDYQARIGTALQAPGTAGVYAAGTSTAATGASVDNANPYYVSLFPGQQPPGAQQTAFPASQTGTAANGTLAFKWHDVLVTRVGTTTTWHIDGALIATVSDASSTANGGAFVGYWDAANSNGTSLVFGVIDNLQIETVPEPGCFVFATIATLAALVTRGRRAA